MINDLDLPIEAIEAIATPGQNDLAVREWCEILKLYKAIKRKDAIEFIRELGTYSPKELLGMPTKELIEFAVWVLAWNKFESLEGVTQ
jgi:hypothetical protein